ncbi:hemolysin III family protein [Exiguobacterium sp. SH3S2]|uniref:PAQR family membrane homeostasis protein TrhA n=1 Tax=Exiguobacterium TaxID=33986 RepID=UPI0008778416|nr:MULTISPECIES: hemolysin III family protein [Exiguobacterium]OGX78348.1 hemolysin [Exiguobacterium sp. SH31]TCI26469.1 hemolysin III family protein [Exiguobacterium sp. SH5S4]TCI37668.1 hemolysin III family protein [Exiguobacterium sp. SH4S7]TCI44064.1 hemolysin III family protein [Exiguobacterium sp. SH3S3]TCI46002.1 hemolysin III family protein [Exiguobacterium sp. SH5S32]
MNSIFREPINALTHLAGAVLAFIALIAMTVKASLLGSPLAIMAAILFGISLVFLYLSSGLYHSIIASPKVIAFFRRIDHAMIYALIAGTYAPLTLLALESPMRWVLFGIVHVLALFGIIFKLVWFHAPRFLSTALYIGMGWLSVFFIGPLHSVIGNGGIFWLLLGGFMYTVGGLIYGFKPKFVNWRGWGFHEVFHLFILFGSFAHFVCVFWYVF